MTWYRVAKAAWISLIVTAAGFVLAKANLFGFEQATGAIADDVSQRLGLVSYRFGDAADGPRAGRDRVRIIHIDDQGLATLKTAAGWPGWPPGYENLAIMIQDVARYPGQPARAVFVDLEITGENLVGADAREEFAGLVDAIGGITASGTRDPRDDSEGWVNVAACAETPLMKLACMVEWGGVPIVLAGGEHGEVSQARAGTSQNSLSDVAVVAPTLVDSRHYPLLSRPEDGFKLYPSAAMYAAHCLVERQRTGKDVCGVPAVAMAADAAAALRRNPMTAPRAPSREDVGASWRDPLAVVWSSDASAAQRKLWERTSTGALPRCRSRVWWGRRLWEQLFRDRAAADGDRQACAYTLALGYDRLVLGFGLTTRDYPELLGDKLIVVGVQFPGSDWAPTPLHGALPGVHYHAMALDNLLEMGPRYRRAEEARLFGSADLFTVPLTFLLLFIVNLASMLRRSFAERYSRSNGNLPLRAAVPWYLLLLGAIVAGSALYIWLLSGLWAAAVVNWLGVFTLVLGAIWFTAREDLRLDLSASLRRSPAGVRVDQFFRRLGASLDRHSGTDSKESS